MKIKHKYKSDVNANKKKLLWQRKYPILRFNRTKIGIWRHKNTQRAMEKYPENNAAYVNAHKLSWTKRKILSNDFGCHQLAKQLQNRARETGCEQSEQKERECWVGRVCRCGMEWNHETHTCNKCSLLLVCVVFLWSTGYESYNFNFWMQPMHWCHFGNKPKFRFRLFCCFVHDACRGECALRLVTVTRALCNIDSLKAISCCYMYGAVLNRSEHCIFSMHCNDGKCLRTQ